MAPVCSLTRAEIIYLVREHLNMVSLLVHTPLLWISGEMQRRPLHSPWFVVPGSDRTLLSKNRNTQYFPTELIVESDTSALWTKMLHWLLNRSPKYRDVSSKRLVRNLPSVQTHNVTDPRDLYIYFFSSFFLFKLFFVLSQASRIGPCGD